jgi:CRISPR-associated exonuclease Cas4
VDLVIETDEGGTHRLLPVDFKLSQRTPGRHFRLQLACYALMLEETYGLPSPEGFLYLISLRKAERIKVTPRLRREVEALLDEIRQGLEHERMPAATLQRVRCVACEFRRFCNDVL